MAPIYSKRWLSLGEGANGSFTVPAGQVGVIRWVTVHNYSGGGRAYFALIDRTAAVFLLDGTMPAFLATNDVDTRQIEMRVVLPGGTKVDTQNDPTIDMTVSGYLFVN